MADCGLGIPLPICIQCGTDQNPCHVKIVGPTLGFLTGVVMAVFCWPASLLCCCCATDAGKKMLGAPADTSQAVGNAIPF
ncbi:polyol transporter 2 [Lecanosticta acicola]|uniref:Polyol transporter 2 n=1 Tax=Lecanosticta acicola TaxID=111012 RepID=A0AAI9E9D9_9PEZI|nr:polyol transporter 2 [Lecanosticta acicola]